MFRAGIVIHHLHRGVRVAEVVTEDNNDVGLPFSGLHKGQGKQEGEQAVEGLGFHFIQDWLLAALKISGIIGIGTTQGETNSKVRSYPGRGAFEVHP